MDDAEEGVKLFDAGDNDNAIAKLSAAIEQFPENAEFLSYRGQFYLQTNQMAKACADLTQVKETLIVGWYDQFLPLLCKASEVPAEPEPAATEEGQ